MNISQGTYKEKIFLIPAGTLIKDNFGFNFTRSFLQRTF